jgi:hypothetical protein
MLTVPIFRSFPPQLEHPQVGACTTDHVADVLRQHLSCILDGIARKATRSLTHDTQNR